MEVFIILFVSIPYEFSSGYDGIAIGSDDEMERFGRLNDEPSKVRIMGGRRLRWVKFRRLR